jgi:hypothetical protein
MQRGITPRDADQMEIWEIAVALGVHKEDVIDERLPRNVRMAIQRANAVAAGEEIPEPKAPDRDQLMSFLTETQ